MFGIPKPPIAREAQEPAERAGLRPEMERTPRPGEPRTKGLHTGPIHSVVAGRTDHLPAEVPNGSYVLPADIVSALGEGNSMAGFKVIKRMFSGLPGGGNNSIFPYGGNEGPYGSRLPHAYGGAPNNGMASKGVPVVIAGGEHVVTPQEVAAAGDNDIDMGHKVLDEFVRRTRAKTIKTLSKLPGPKND
jgi:hypothetical protein